MTLSAEEKILKAKIALVDQSPFFGYLSYHLQQKEDKYHQLPPWGRIGVDIKGNMLFNPEYINSLKEKEIKGVVCHELLHIAMLHFLRRGSRMPVKWNFAIDLAVNSILLRNGFSLPKGGVTADNADEFSMDNKKIDKVSEKSAENIYDELPDMPFLEFIQSLLNQRGDGGQGESNGYSIGGFKPFDYHDDSKFITAEDRLKLENEWNSKIEEAAILSKKRGKLPFGMERYLKDLHKSEINWRHLLQRHIVTSIPSDFTWTRRSKRSLSVGTYLPNTTREKIEVIVAVDTSGSIGAEELHDFMSEIVGMAKAYSNRISMRLLTHDSKVHDDYTIENGNVEKIKSIKIHGGGGTAHLPVFEYVKDKIRRCNVIICFTDGDSDLNSFDLKKFPMKKIFVISQNGHAQQIEDTKRNVIIQIKGETK